MHECTHKGTALLTHTPPRATTAAGAAPNPDFTLNTVLMLKNYTQGPTFFALTKEANPHSA